MSKLSASVVRLLVVSLLLAGAACSSDDPPRTSPKPPRTGEISLSQMMRHLESLEAAASLGGGTRAAGTEGYEASVAHVVETLEAAGYGVTEQTFSFPYFEQIGRAKLGIVGGHRFEDGLDFKAMLFAASGRFTAPVTPVGVEGEDAGGGCESDDFAGFPDGAVALVRPGPCFYRDIVVEAQEAGAAGVIVSFPEWSRETGVLRPTLIDPDAIEVPVFGVTEKAGDRLARPKVRLSVKLSTVVEERTTSNVIAESPEGDADDAVMLGGHLDSVIDGPGINDNGSGIAVLLAVAQRLADEDLEKQVRFGFWGGEELGLLGSDHYVEGMSSEELEGISAYMNFDMVGSPNGVTYIYAPDGGERSEEIHTAFEGHFESRDLPHIDIDLEGRSDHGPFLRAGIPVGGIFTGAEEIKSPRLADRFGGTADAPMDHCYHQSCDDLSNVDRRRMDQIAEAIYAVTAGLVLR